MEIVDRTRRTHRPHRVAEFLDFDGDGEVVRVIRVTQEYGRRAGLHTGKSQTAEHRRASNRRDRRDARQALRRDPDSVSARPRRCDSIWLAR